MNEQLIPMLVVYKGALAGSRWSLQNASITIGRSSDCDIVIPEREISRYHVRIESDLKGYLLRDLGSKNGTRVNGSILSGSTHQLKDGDEIVLADVVHLGYVAGEATLPLDSSITVKGELLFNKATKSVQIGMKILEPPLSPAQFSLLTLLIEAAGSVISREDVIAFVWPDVQDGVSDQAVDALVYRLRERLTELNPEQNFVVTVRGHGFRFA